MAASMLFDVAMVSLIYELVMRNWPRAVVCCMSLNVATENLLDGIAGKRLADPEVVLDRLVGGELRNVAEAAAYVAHHAGNPLVAVATLEIQTSVLFELRMRHTSARTVERRLAAGHVSESELAEHVQRNLEPWGPGGTEGGAEAMLLEQLALSDRDDPLEQFFLTAHMSHAVRAARGTGRVVVYVVPGLGANDGVAIRVNPDDEGDGLTASTWLPGFQAPALTARVAALREAFHDGAPEFQETLDWTGASIWEPVLNAWADLLSRPVAVIPVTHAALLPLYTATERGEPACTRLDLTLAPSARALHFASLSIPAQAPSPAPFVAADPWYGDRELAGTELEAATIAEIYQCDPLVISRQGDIPEPGPDVVAARLRAATVAHLACHGQLGDDGPSLLLGGILPLDNLLGGDENLLPGRPTVVLSACEVGGFSAQTPSAEQYGFPAGLLSIGARSVVGSLWPVPDSPATVRVMADFHRRLAGVPSRVALPAAIAAARNRGIPPRVWGSLTHFGA